jgi:hypothetical protein
VTPQSAVSDDEMRRDAEETLSVTGKEDCLAHSQLLAAYVLVLLQRVWEGDPKGAPTIPLDGVRLWTR